MADETSESKAIGRNIRDMRSREGLTQRELATRAGISEVTLYHAERGKPIRLTTLKKIAVALNQNLDELRSKRSRILTKTGDFVIHRDENLVWYQADDYRKTIPEDNQEKIQDPKERIRLGRLGLVPMFYATPTFVMAHGPGITVLELFSPYTGFNSRLYEHAIVYCMRGRVEITISEETTLLEEHDAFGYNNNADMTFGPADPISPTDLPPLVMWIGANRKGQSLDTKA